MALNRLTTAEMVRLTQPCVEAQNPCRRALEAVPTAAALLPDLEAAHEALLETQFDPEIERLASTADERDQGAERHASLTWAIWHTLQAHIHLFAGTPMAADLAAVQERLFPSGRSGVLNGDGDSEVQHLAARLTTEQQTLLVQIPVRGSNLLMAIRAWAQVAASVRSWASVSGAPASGPAMAESALPTTAVRIRDAWICAVNSLRTRSAVAAVDEPLIGGLLQRIANAESQAVRRARGELDREPDYVLEFADIDTLPGGTLAAGSSPGTEIVCFDDHQWPPVSMT